MKNKRLLAILLCISFLGSSFSGMVTTYAKNNQSKNVNKMDSIKAPDQNITTEVPVLFNDADIVPGKNVSDYVTESNSSKSDVSNNTISYSQKYNIGDEEIEKLLKEGYSIQEIEEADQISNEIGEDPINLLESAKISGKKLNDIKEEKLKEIKESCINSIKSKYPDDYEKLKKENMKDDDIIIIMSYAEANNLQLSDELIKEYKMNNISFSKAGNGNSVSDKTKKKYKITEKDAEYLTEDIIMQLEDIAEKSGKPVKELIKSYLKSIKK
jgi:predicted double-glycine peptidase